MNKLIILFLLVAGSADASQKMCSTKIMAVSGGNPALKKVTIVIKKGKEVIATRKRHSFGIRLRCGVKYKAVATSGDKKVTRNFYAGGLVKLPLDR